MDKEGIGKSNPIIPEDYITLFYNCLKKKANTIKGFNFQTVYDISLFLMKNLKPLYSSKTLSNSLGKRNLQFNSLPFYICYD